MPINIVDPIKIRVKPDAVTVIITGGTGATTQGANVGAGIGVFKDKNINTLEFKSLIAGSNINLVNDANTITINSTVDTSGFVSQAVFTGYTGTTNTRIGLIESDLTTLSGQTDTNTQNILDNATEIAILSGITTQNTSDIQLVSGETVTNYNLITGITTNISNKLDVSVFNTYTGNTNTRLNTIEGDITTNTNNISNKLNTTVFDTYTGNTSTTLSGLRTDIDTVSGITTTNANNISNKLNTSDFNSYSATTETTINSKTDKNLSIVELTGATSLSESDNGKSIECDGTFTVTIPTGLSVGWQALIVNIGSGEITLAAGGTLQSKDSNVLLASQFGGATVYHRGSNNILAIGDLTA